MAVVMMSTANLAYRKAVARTRERSVEGTNASSAPWLKHFVEQLPEDDSSFALTAMVEPERHRKERLLRSSANPYFSRFAWFMYLRITNNAAAVAAYQYARGEPSVQGAGGATSLRGAATLT